MSEPAFASRVAPGRSCVACRRRKIRCDRQQPCSYCIKIKSKCSYPGQDGGKQPGTEVLSRLQRLEMSLHRLESNQVNVSSPQTSGTARFSEVRSPETPLAVPSQQTPETGKLVSEEGDTRYITSSFWADLDEAGGDNVATQEEQEPSLTPLSTSSRAARSQPRGELLFGTAAACEDLSSLHPKGHHVFALWQLFLENVDPVLKIIHVPVTQRQILRASQNLSQVPPAFESLMFSIYYAAITSIQSSVSLKSLLQEDRDTLLNRYQLGFQQALSKAHFMTTPDVTTLQALTIYLVCARQSVDQSYLWSMTGVLVRLATKLGLHRDPATLGLSPWSSEIRRRLWWHIVILELRIAEENDMDPFICEHMWDTKFPSNVNDADLDINMTEMAPESPGRTEMTFTLIRLEATYTARKVLFSPKFTADNGYPTLSLQDKTDALDSLQRDLEEKYLQYCDSKMPICFLTVTSIRMILAKWKLTINHPARDGFTALSEARLNDLIQSSIEIIEYAHTLRVSDKYSRWVWLFQKYIEWDAVAFLLHGLIAVPFPDLLTRAWTAVDTFFRLWQGRIPGSERRWHRLENLRSKAAVRQGLESVPPAAVEHQDAIPVAQNGRNGQYPPALYGVASGSADSQSIFIAATQDILHTNSVTLPEAFFSPMGAQIDEWTFGSASYIMQ